MNCWKNLRLEIYRENLFYVCRKVQYYSFLKCFQPDMLLHTVFSNCNAPNWTDIPHIHRNVNDIIMQMNETALRSKLSQNWYCLLAGKCLCAGKCLWAKTILGQKIFLKKYFQPNMISYWVCSDCTGQNWTIISYVHCISNGIIQFWAHGWNCLEVQIVSKLILSLGWNVSLDQNHLRAENVP